jgi:DNA polymerase-3 subunit epsilon
VLGWWRKRRAANENARWVVLDVETSGMDVARDRLLSVGAVAISSSGQIRPADSIEIVYRQASASSRANILVHGIGVGAQMSGVDPREATMRFLDYVGTSPIVAFHAPFDRGFLIRAAKAFVGQPFDNPWLDLAELAPVVDPKVRLKSLDEWLGRYGIAVSARHSAAADAYATALLAARLLPAARALGAADFSALRALAAQARWMPA